MASQDDVLCGQINLHKGSTGVTSLLLHLQNSMQTGFQPQPNPPGSQVRGNKINSFIVCVQEPPIYDKKVVGLGRSNQVLYDRKCDRPRAAIFASRNLQLWPMQDYTDGDLVTCLWKLQGGREVIVASAYLDITLQMVIS